MSDIYIIRLHINLNTPGVMYRFCGIKSLTMLDLNALKFSATDNCSKLSHAAFNKTLWVSDLKTIWEIRPLPVQD